MQFLLNTNASTRLARTIVRAMVLSLAVSSTAAFACADGGKQVAADAVFIEGAPIDRLLVTNRSDAGWMVEQVTWDLTPSTGQVIFDTTGSGAGVEVFQPFRQLSATDVRQAGGKLADDASPAILAAEPTVTDGDQSLVLQFKSFGPSQVFGMSIDVDDQIASRQITVERNEMQGASLEVVFVHKQKPRRTLTAAFDDMARASVCGPADK